VEPKLRSPILQFLLTLFLFLLTLFE